jgi:hypothetical protein
MGKRISVPTAKEGQLVARWGRPTSGEEPDLVYAWGGKGADKSDSRCLMNALEDAPTSSGRGLRAELELRGYDISTLRFTINLKETSCA